MGSTPSWGKTEQHPWVSCYNGCILYGWSPIALFHTFSLSDPLFSPLTCPESCPASFTIAICYCACADVCLHLASLFLHLTVQNLIDISQRSLPHVWHVMNQRPTLPITIVWYRAIPFFSCFVWTILTFADDFARAIKKNAVSVLCNVIIHTHFFLKSKFSQILKIRSCRIQFFVSVHLCNYKSPNIVYVTAEIN